MNNRTQQRFDRSIREAVAATTALQRYQSDERSAYVIESHRRKLPSIMALLATKTHRGVPLDRQMLKDLEHERRAILRAIGQ